MFTNGSMEAAALLFRYMIEPGDRVIVEQPSYDRTLLLLGRTGAEIVGVPLEADGIDARGVRGGARRRPGEARPRDPQLPQPGRLHALGGEARAPGRARGRARLLDLRGRPLPAGHVRATSCRRRCCRSTRSEPRDPRLLVLEDGQPGRSGRLPRRSRGADPDAREARLRALHLARTCWPSRWSSSSAAPAPSPSNIEFVNGALAERRDALVEALRRADPGGRVRRPRRRLLPLARPRRRRRHARRCSRPPRREGVAFVAGPDFMLEGGALEPAPLVRERPRRAGRRGRRAARPGARGAARRRAGLVGEPAGCGGFARPTFSTK